MTRTAATWILALASLLLVPLADAQMMFRAEPPPGLVLESDLEGFFDLHPGTSRSLLVRLRNEGNETLELSAQAFEHARPEEERLLGVLAEPARLTLEPGASREVELNVTARAEAPLNATARVSLMLQREGHQQVKDLQVPVRIGEPCPSCAPEPPEQGGAHVIGPGGGMGRARNATPRASPPTLDEADPYQEVPGPGAALVAAGGALALALRRATDPRYVPARRHRNAPPAHAAASMKLRRRAARSPRSRRPALARLVALVALVLLVAPGALAQSADARRFVLTEGAREGEDAVLTLRLVDGRALDVVLSLTDGAGKLVDAERSRAAWPFGDSETYRFRVGNETSLVLRIAYRTPEEESRVEEISLSLPEPARPRVDLVDVVRGPQDALTLSLRNLGDATSAAGSAHLETEAGERLGKPLSRALDPLAPGEEAELSFLAEDPPPRIVVVLTLGAQTQRLQVRVPAAEDAARLELVQASVDGAGRANFTVAHLRGEGLEDTIAYLETSDGQRVGSPAAAFVGALAAGSTTNVTFQLHDDVSNVTLVLKHRSGAERFPVRLEEDDGVFGGSDLELTSDLPSREERPGGAANFELRLKNDDDKDALVSLRAEGLPSGYEVTFSVDGSAVRTMLVPEGATRSVVASVRVPEGASRDAGSTFPFQVIAETEGEEAARVELSLSVRGAPRLELQGQNWFTSLAPGATTTLSVLVRNTGSAPVYDVEMAVAAPSGWTVSFEPASFERIDPNEAREVQLSIRAAEDAGAGRYVLDVSAGNDDISARSRSLSAEVVAGSSSKLGWLAGAGIAGIAATALIVKLRRR